MLFGSRILTVSATLAFGLGIAASTNALSLADLVVPGASFSAGNGATFSRFVVKISGQGLSEDLSEYQIFPNGDGFALVGDFNNSPKGGKIKLTYDVAGLDISGAAIAMLADDPDGLLKIKEKIFNDKKIASLETSSTKGPTRDDAAFDPRAAIEVLSKIKIRGDLFDSGSIAAIGQSVVAVPEPTTALMLVGGLAGIAAARHRLRH